MRYGRSCSIPGYVCWGSVRSHGQRKHLLLLLRPLGHPPHTPATLRARALSTLDALLLPQASAANPLLQGDHAKAPCDQEWRAC